MIRTGKVAEMNKPIQRSIILSPCFSDANKLKKYIAPPTTDTLYIARKKCLT